MLTLILHDMERNLVGLVHELGGEEKRVATNLCEVIKKKISECGRSQELIAWYKEKKCEARDMIDELKEGSANAIEVAEKAYWLINIGPDFYSED